MVMWDSIFVLIHHFHRPYKKKDVLYLIDSRLKDSRKKDLILFHDINIIDKCNACKEYQPWIILKNTGEGLFLLKKFIEKCEPWITTAIQENIYELKYSQEENFESIFVLITKINSREKLYELLNPYKDVIKTSDIRIKNQCLDCKNLTPWLIIENKPKGFELAKVLNENFKPFIVLKKQNNIYNHNIPNEIKDLEKWNPKYGNRKIEI